MSVPTQEESLTVADALARVDEAHAVLASVDLSLESSRSLMTALGQVEVARRRLEAAGARLVSEVDRTGAYGVDGHTSTSAAMRHVGRVPGKVVAPQVRMARELVRLPQLAAAFASGQVSAAHVDVIARTTRNPRVAEFVTDETDRWFTEQACDTELSFASFEQLIKAWESLVDVDGAHERSERQHQNRDGNCRQRFDGSVTLDGRFGALDGAVVMAVLEAETQRLFDEDWAAAKAVHGDEVTFEHLARTPAQRRSDAIVAIFRRAATIDPGDVERVQPEPLVNIVVDQETFERGVARAAGEEPGPDDPSRAADVRCHTTSGVRLTPEQVVLAAVLGHVRRVVLDSRSVVIDLGRKQRLFRGGARDAVLLGGWSGLSPGCGWAGCGNPRCQCDHKLEWSKGGETSPENGQPMCGFHNRLKNLGFFTADDERGRPSFHRPDGSQITPPV